MPVTAPVAAADDADLERRFGGLKRLYGARGYARVRAARVAVVGLGGVGSWAVEALARSGVAQLVLVDLDHVSESNVNRQIQALGATLGMSKARGARAPHRRHPSRLRRPLRRGVRRRRQLARPAAHRGRRRHRRLRPEQGQAGASPPGRAARGIAFVTCGAAGGKRRAEQIEIDDLHATTHDPLLASLRQRLRSQHGAPRTGKMGVRCVFSRESVAQPEPEDAACEVGDDVPSAARRDNSLNCHGYGSTVVVTASFGMAAAGEAIAQLLEGTLPLAVAWAKLCI